MADVNIVGKDGKSVGSRTLSGALAKATVSLTSLHRAVVAEEANDRQGTQSVKTRAEVKGGGKKPYKQKKTGNARQGTTRAPHYAHGGVALAVKPRDYSKKVNKKEKRAAIVATLSAHIEAGHVSVVDSIVFGEPKTKDAISMLNALGLKGERRILVILPAYDLPTYKSFRNLPNVTVRTAPSVSNDDKTQSFSARDLLLAKKIVIAQDALAKIEEVWAK